MVAIYTALLLAAPQWGKHAVGLEVAALEDSTRPREGKPRPIQMSLWYPAEKGGQEDLTFGDYVTLLASELGPASPEQVRTAVEEHASFLRTRAKMSEGDIERWLARPMRAIPRAPPLADRKSTRLNSSHRTISYAVFCLKKKTSTAAR